jgi:hypothetical protein
MIVVIGSPLYRPGTGDRPSAAVGLAVGIAAAATAAGGSVQLVGRVGEDPAGDATLLALAAGRIGHVATRRDPARPTPFEPAQAQVGSDPNDDADGDPFGVDPIAAPIDDGTSLRAGDSPTLDPGDVGLALRYLDSYRVIVVAEPLSRTGFDAAAESAAYAGARLVAIVADGGSADPLPEGAIVIEAPVSDLDGVFARTIGMLAVALDAGADPAAALEGAVASAGWVRAGH